MVQSSTHPYEGLSEEILRFSRHIAGSCQISGACLCSNHASGLAHFRRTAQVLLVIEGAQPRLMNYAKAVGNGSLSVLAVDKWVFERDVDRGILGEALADALILPYKALINGQYLHLHEVALKKRLILELLQNLVIDYPELSYEFYIKPDYFMYETLLTRARLFPPMLYSLSSLAKEENSFQQILQGFLEGLKTLEGEGVISFSGGYVRISKEFVDKARGRKIRFTNLLKTGNRALFASLLGMLPQMTSALSQNREVLFSLRGIFGEGTRIELPIEDPEKHVYVKIGSGLVPLANKMNIAVFARKILSADKDAQVRITSIGGILNDVYLVSTRAGGEERKAVVKRFRDWSNFKWFPLTLWSVGTRTFAVLGSSRLDRECAINRLLHSKGFDVPEIMYVSPNERLIFMEYVVGEDLSRVVRKIADSKSDSELTKDLSLVEKVGDLFAKVHALNVALGDTKPENILVDKEDRLYLIDLEQASRNGDRTWDLAEFLYYAGHYVSPFADTRRVELMAKAFINGYLVAGGDIKTIKRAGNPKYTKVFGVFTFPHIMLAISNTFRKTQKPKD